MATVMSEIHALQRLNNQVVAKGVIPLLSWLNRYWREYRKAQYLLWSNYRSHPMARRVNRRAWRRHSALFISMYEEEHGPH